MGPLMVMASYYVQQQAVTWASFYVSLPVAFIVTAILVVNNIRDVEEDREAGKRRASPPPPERGRRRGRTRRSWRGRT